jgi:hypothetical protein
MTYEDFQKTKWLSIYGASVALQCHQQILDGKGSDFTDSMENIKEEAAAIADWAMEGEQL